MILQLGAGETRIDKDYPEKKLQIQCNNDRKILCTSVDDARRKFSRTKFNVSDFIGIQFLHSDKNKEV